MKFIENIEQSDGTDIALSTPCSYIMVKNDDSTNSITFDLDGDNSLSSPITVKAEETFSGYFYPFENVTITNASSCAIRVLIGK